ncbi:aromatic ring-hydroxylating oxygenase subunit alpha [Pseudarthrobacter cellobiosi]|uniref:aromatic ring-hydroxylating oxygenase subunit alpha n=1 Tax=Pseudarthrobacter cellobiosi TaxID=2953654 RepID=UPI00208EFB62|nr:aromatic ring-hydroxylating dioxygenase subunit alpha [Pseudarthrobacter sp. HLT1-5]MCO4253737.1 aromatic ring-hydroxylating dioxygenase subunit alpha [Pseudarthrobacter sp. HLT1-5]
MAQSSAIRPEELESLMSVCLNSSSIRWDAVNDLVKRREQGFSLEAGFYASEDVFAADVELIFGRHWVFAATEGEIPEAGDFVTVNVGPYSIVIIRDDDDAINAFHNVCRHRGSRILDETRGSVGNLVCPYHSWTYNTAGSLLYAESQNADFDRSHFGLKKVNLKNVAGLLFICLSQEPPADMDEVASVIEPYVAPHCLPRSKVAAQVDIIENGNWKLVMENNRECYHCGVHHELANSLFPIYGYVEGYISPRLQPVFERYTDAQSAMRQQCSVIDIPHEAVEELDTRITGFRIEREPIDNAGESMTMDGRAASARLMGGFETARLGRLGLHLQPNAWFHFMSDHAVTFSALPLGPNKTLVRTTWLVDQDAVEGEDYDVEQLKFVWEQTNNQDRELVERTQLGVESPAYRPGPYSAPEYQVEAFCNWYVSRLSEQLPYLTNQG